MIAQRFPRSHFGFLLYFLSLAPVIIAGGFDPLLAQTTGESPARWTLAPGITYYRINATSVNGSGIGPVITVAYRGGADLGGELTIGAILSSDGFYDFSGIHADLGVAYTIARRDRVDIILSAGATALAGDDSDGTQGIAAGGYVAARGDLWLSDWAGISTRVAARYMPQEFNSLFSPSVAVGLGFQF